MKAKGERFQYCGQWWTVIAVEEESYRIRSDDNSYGFIAFSALGDVPPRGDTGEGEP